MAPTRFTAPIEPAQAVSLVAAFNGGFIMNAAEGGYYTEGRVIDPLVAGAASLVIYADGSVTVGSWDSDVFMTPNVVAVRQNLVPLVAGGQPTAQAASLTWQAWGDTCGSTSCASTVPASRTSGVRVSASPLTAPSSTQPDPALTRCSWLSFWCAPAWCGAWSSTSTPTGPSFVTYDPSPPDGPAAPANGSSLQPSSVQGPATFFTPSWARDFVTMSTRPTPPAG